MRSNSSHTLNCTRAVFPLLLLLVAGVAKAERLPLKPYTTADGLAHNIINKIVRDSRGFLWFCTADGLSRFDGYSFTNYGTSAGLPHPAVNDLLETRSGEYWVATGGGLVRFNPKGTPGSRVIYANDVGSEPPPMFTVVGPEDTDRRGRSFTVLLEARDGTLWCGTYKGLSRLNVTGQRLTLTSVDIGLPNEYPEQRYIADLVEDRFGSLWIATPSGLYRRWPDGTTARYTTRDGLPSSFLNDLLIDRKGQLWVGARYGGFCRLVADETHAPPSVAFTLTPRDYQHDWINQLFETSEHKLWAATPMGLLEFNPDGDTGGRRYRFYTPRNGLSDHHITALNEDMGGNLWLGSGTGSGAMKLAHSGFVTYDEQDGILSGNAIFSDRAGGVCSRAYVLGDKRASIFDGGKVDLLDLGQATYWQRLGHFDGQQFAWFVPDALKGKYFGWIGNGVTLQARSGEWWVVMNTDLYRFPPADSFTQIIKSRLLEVFGKKSVLADRQIFRIFEDSRERIWVSTVNSGGNGLAVWERASARLRDLTEAANLPSLKDDLVRSFGEDREGNVWLGLSTGLVRYRDGVFAFFGAKEGLPPGAIMDIHIDQRGQLWLASSRGGLVRVESAAERLSFTSYTTAEGLSTNSTEVIAEDAGGEIYVGTGRGLDRLNPTTGRVRHYTTADGLARGVFFDAFHDRNGALWFGTAKGFSRFVPAKDEPAASPPVLISGLRIAGLQQAISALGETEIRLPDIAADQNQLQIDFLGLSFASGEVLRYQYRLEGANADWSTPVEQRTVNFAQLSPGTYKFLVRAVTSEGSLSAQPAAVTFTILPPVWQRWWFLALVFMTLGLILLALYRYRVGRLLEVERIRTRIATDLHDDIGAGLSRIAVLSEVARHEADKLPPVGERLSVIARASRELVDSMSDIVWVINPERDQLRDLTQRMRRFASDVFTARNIRLTFRGPSGEQHLKVGADVRRQIFLIFKEAINNIARHSQCTEAEIELKVEGGRFALTIHDNGRGFDPASAVEGNGLANMRSRARMMSAELQIDSSPIRGTTIILRAPLRTTVKEHNGRLRGTPA
ncbi:MAG: histidine kinase [Pyrinomonadaceae bacterium]|nr:histidine kinase [Pyrinomonadaceae bacterium]